MDKKMQMAMMLKGVSQHSDIPEIKERLRRVEEQGRALRVKFGLDPSAPDIHLGHAVPLRKIRQLQEMGAVAVIVIGDFTGRIGDPSGKSKTRPALSMEEVRHNADTYMEQIFRIIDRDRTEVHFNSEWLDKMSFADVIALASGCTVARIMERDDFHSRFSKHQPLSMHEILYPLIQAYDSVAVRADIELGGTDQTFNIMLGRDIQRDYGMEPQLTLFMPLLEGIDGVEKMSKSLGNYIGITEPPSVIYEKLMRIPDSLIIRYYELCTDLHPDEIGQIAAELEEAYLVTESANEKHSTVNPRDIKMRLARIISGLYSSEEEAIRAEERFKAAFQRDELPEDAAVVAVELPTAGAAKESHGEILIDALVRDGAFPSKGELRRMFRQGAVRLNGEKVISPEDVKLDGRDHALRIGKRRFFRVEVRG